LVSGQVRAASRAIAFDPAGAPGRNTDVTTRSELTEVRFNEPFVASASPRRRRLATRSSGSESITEDVSADALMHPLFSSDTAQVSSSPVAAAVKVSRLKIQ